MIDPVQDDDNSAEGVAARVARAINERPEQFYARAYGNQVLLEFRGGLSFTATIKHTEERA